MGRYTVDDVRPAPWSRHGWSGSLLSVDGCDTKEFEESDVSEVLQFASSGDRWDGETAGMARLKDGRFISWEAGYGPTGDGFCRDAYGGEADINFATTEAAALGSLSESARSLLRAHN